MRTSQSYILFLLLVSTFGMTSSHAQVAGKPTKDSEEVVKLVLLPKSVPEIADSVRLLPTDFELRPGNAAVVLLRLPWEQTHFMNKILPKAREFTNLEYNDPKIAAEFSDFFGHFRNQMHRAAYMRNADWNYPFGEEPMMGILLPDVQGMRLFAGYGMALWVGTQIDKGNLDEAREGILIQLAVARHVSRTPFAVCQLVGNVIADSGLQRLEILIQQPKSDNFYYALSTLPQSLGISNQQIFEYEALALPKTLPSLTDPAPPVGDPAWQQIAAEFAEFLNGFGLQMEEAQLEKLKERILKVASEDLPSMYGVTDDQVASMSHEEKAMRLLLGASRQINSQATAAVSLPLPAAIQKLQELQPKIAQFRKRLDLPEEISSFAFSFIGPEALLGMNRFGRKVKMLQVIEAIRDHASNNDGALPAALSDIKLHVPLDPATGKSFVYKLDGETATLSAEPIPGMNLAGQSRMRTYQITIDQGQK